MQHEFFSFDVFLSHSSKDKDTVREVALCLLEAGLKVWFDEWSIGPGDHIPTKIEHGLEHSRVLILFLSNHSIGSDWSTLESHAFRFRDPLNKQRRFIPVKLDKVEIKGSIGQFLYIDMSAEERQKGLAKLVETCRDSRQTIIKLHKEINPKFNLYELDLNGGKPRSYAFCSDGKRVIVGLDCESLNSRDKDTIKLFDIESGKCLRSFKSNFQTAHEGIESITWDSSENNFLSTSANNVFRLWNVNVETYVHEFTGHQASVWDAKWSNNETLIASCSFDHTVKIWNANTGICEQTLIGHTNFLRRVLWINNDSQVISCGDDNTVRIWDVASGKCLRILEGHSHWILSMATNKNQTKLLTGSCDNTMRLWDLETGICLKIFQGHTSNVEYISWITDELVLSTSPDSTLRLWNIESDNCSFFELGYGESRQVRGLKWLDNDYAITGNFFGDIRAWELSSFIRDKSLNELVKVSEEVQPQQIQYTNAKVLIVGDSSAGKTGLSKVLAGQAWQPSDSTVGAWATQWKLSTTSSNDIEREIWLWDFGGQADQRLIHQLYMDETTLAVLVFDGQKEDALENLNQWARELSRPTLDPFQKILVAGRIDAGGLRVSKERIDTFVKNRGFIKYIETSAKTNIGCDTLKETITKSINWDDLPCRTTLLMYKKLQEEIVRLKDSGKVLLRFNELRETLQLRDSDLEIFSDNELDAVLSLLSGPGVVWKLKFGSWVLLKPEIINAYAQSVIQTMREDPFERGCINEKKLLEGKLSYSSSIVRLGPDEEPFVLLAMHQLLIERNLCLREHTDEGNVLIFPSYYRRERAELLDTPAALVSYRFNGFLDDIYATLVVRLHHTKSFNHEQLWHYAADFRTLTNKKLGIKLTRTSEDSGELDVYFDPNIPIEEKIIFANYIHEHLLEHASEVIRLRHFICPHCGTAVGNRDIAMKKLAEGKADIACINCDSSDKRIPLKDEMERLFSSEKTKRQVRELKEETDIFLDNESKERVLVGEIISTVSLAGQICRELVTSDHGIDMEIEFKSDKGVATGRKIYLQLKSGDSYLRKRKSDDKEIFDISKQRHERYWMQQEFPVWLVIRNSEGNIRWMEIRDYLKRVSDNGKRKIGNIEFSGQRFDVMSVRNIREEILQRSH